MDSGGYVVVSVFVGRPRAGRDGIGIGCKEGGKDTYHDDGLLCEKCASLLHRERSMSAYWEQTKSEGRSLKKGSRSISSNSSRNGTYQYFQGF